MSVEGLEKVGQTVAKQMARIERDYEDEDINVVGNCSIVVLGSEDSEQIHPRVRWGQETLTKQKIMLLLSVIAGIVDQEMSEGAEQQMIGLGMALTPEIGEKLEELDPDEVQAMFRTALEKVFEEL